MMSALAKRNVNIRKRKRIMKKIRICLFVLSTLPYVLQAQHTFSICAVDTVTGEVGAAGASCVDATMTGGSGVEIISSIHPGVGAIHTQAAYLPANQTYGDSLMNRGRTCVQIVDSLVAHDAQGDPSNRQYGVVELRNGHPSSAGYSGSSCPNYYNQISGKNYSIQGNTLLGAKILDSMQARFLRTPGDLACKLMAAMQGAKVIGADTRCAASGNSSLSSFLRVACSSDKRPNYALSLLVKQGPAGFEPIDSLQKMFNLAHPSCSTPLNCTLTTGDLSPAADNALAVEVVPNPFTGQARVLVRNGVGLRLSLEIFSAEGQLLRAVELGQESEYILSGSDFKKGFYFYRITGSNGLMTPGKFIVLP
jgi:uncharacterized Ntn-hydrolase superfamily protein